MSVPLLIEQRDLEMAIGARAFAQLADQQGAGRAPAGIVLDLLQVASDEAAGLLGDGFTPDEMIGLARRDSALRRKIALVGIGVGGVARPEFMGADGKFLFADAYKEARKDLKDMGAKRERSVAEQQNGTINRKTGPRVGLRKGHPRVYIFADSPDRRGGGPF